MRHTGWVALGLGLLAVLSSRSAKADLFTNVAVNGSFEQCSDSGTSAASCNTSGAVPLGPGTANFGAAASARASFGDLGTSVSGLASCTDVVDPYNCFGVNHGNALAAADFIDTFNIASGPASGFLVFSAFSDGASDVTCVGPAAGFICGNSVWNTFLSVTGALINGVSGDSILPSGREPLTITVPYASSSNVIAFLLESVGSCFASNDTNCNGFSNFFATFAITGVSVEDSSGVVDPSAVLLTESGTDYNSKSVGTTPEPGTLFLLGTGLISGLLLRHRPRSAGERRCRGEYAGLVDRQ